MSSRSDELDALIEQRDHLLASIEDLDAEHRVGDMDDDDYQTLRRDYVHRAAVVLEAIEAGSAPAPDTPAERGGTRRWVVAGAVVAFAAVAGVLVANASGQRGSGAITGSTGTLREALATCQTTSFQEPAKGIDCYDEILADAPDNLEALTYQGWAMVRDDRIEEGAANFERVVELDPDYADVRVFRAVVASRAQDWDRAAEEIDRFYRNDPSPSAIAVLQSQNLERNIFVMRLDEPTRECWQEAAASQPDDQDAQDAALAQAFLDSLGACLDELLVASPDDVDALTSRVYSLVGPNAADMTAARTMADRAVAADPSDANARLLRGSLAVSAGDLETASADLTALEDGPRPTMSFLVGGPEALRDAIEASDAAPDPTGDDGATEGSDRLPNRSGG